MEQFEAVRNTPGVPILFQALGNNLENSHFSQIGQRLTRAEIAEYVKCDKDYFQLSSSWKTITPSGYDPLFGLKTLDSDKLETFVTSALQRADRNVYLYVRLVNLIETWEKPQLLSLLIPLMFARNAHPLEDLPDLFEYLTDLFPSSYRFAYVYLDHAAKLSDVDSNFFLERFYVKN